jgi:DNA-binding NtrC family response regulator
MGPGKVIVAEGSEHMSLEKILIVEDNEVIRRALEIQLQRRRFDVIGVSTLAVAQDYLGKDNWDLVFVDVRLPDGEGTDILRILQNRSVKPLVVMMTGHASIESAVACMRDGAFDYLIKPFSSDQIDITLKKAQEFTQLIKVNRYLSQGDPSESTGSELLGRSPAMQGLRDLIRKVARTQATVLVQGESGTGKELVSRAIYRESSRANGPFIKVNCAAIPENLIESEFFGHEKGAFTGALTKREGRFELAHGGTILLDEISEVAPHVQAKLLRVLQERELERVGGNRLIRVDVRVIATTNRNLEESIARKEFRQDLYFRLNVVPISVPPLRERREDIPFLAEQFMQRLARKHGVRVNGISASCQAALVSHDWPGNVRELQNVIERAVILCPDGGELSEGHLGFQPSSMSATTVAVATPVAQRVASGGGSVETATPAASMAGGSGSAISGLAISGSATSGSTTSGQGPIVPLDQLEKHAILQAVDACGGNRTQAARCLGISVRTMRNKLREYGVAPGGSDAGSDDSDGPGDEVVSPQANPAA